MSYVRAAVLANFPDVARQLGLDAGQALRQAGLSLEHLSTPDALLRAEDVVSLIEGTAHASGCDTVGLRLSQPRTMSGFGVVGLLLAQSPSIRAALQLVLRYLPLINESLALRLEEDGELAVFSQELLTDVPMPTRHTIELSLAASLTLFRTLLGADWRPSAVYFRHPPPRSLEYHNHIFRCRCVFDSDLNGITFPRHQLDSPNRLADPAMARYAEQLIAPLSDSAMDSVVARVRRLIYIYMPLQRAAVRPVAQSLACSVRKLQLDLADGHTTFEQLLDAARWERAQHYLQYSRYSIDQVAALLGYQQPTSFTRWFRTQAGMSPSAWRQQRQAASAAARA